MEGELNSTNSWQERDRLSALSLAATNSDTPREPLFDGLAELVAAVCNVPIAGIGFFAPDKTWSKSTFGLGGLHELPTDIASWHLTLESDQGFLEISDLSENPNTKAHPMVTGAPKLRFYAAKSLLVPKGNRLGSLHVLDYRPRRLTAPQRAAFKHVAEVVVQLLVARTEERYHVLLGRTLERSDDGICVTDAETLHVEYANENARHLFGHTLLEMLNLGLGQLQTPEGFSAFHEAIKPLYNNEKPYVDLEIVALRKDGTAFPAETRLQLWHDGAHPKLLAAFRDKGDRKQAVRTLAESERLLCAVMAAVPEAILVISREGRLVEMTPVGLAMLEAENLAQAQSKPLLDYVKPKYRADFQQLYAQVFQGLSGQIEYQVVGLKGGSRWLETNAVPLRDDSGHIISLLAATRDINGRKQADETLGHQQAAMESARDGMAILGQDYTFLYLNKAFVQLYGHADPAEFVGQSWKVFYGTAESQRIEGEVFPILQSEGRWAGESAGTRRDGTQFAEALSITVTNDGKLVWVSHDISALKRAEQERATALHMTYLAQHDYLTGLPNRLLLTYHFGKAVALALQSKKIAAILYIDLDNFKLVNDFLGHEAGDKLLREIACRLQGCVRESDTVCRQGGDEFLILLSEIDNVNDIAHIAEKLLNACAEPHAIDDHEVHVSASIGISLFPNDGRGLDVLSGNADAAMYHAKESGRNNFQFYDPIMNARAHERFTLENDLRRALKHNELVLYYQPMLDLATKSLIGCDALLRWRSPDRGLVMPDDYLPLIEESGLIVPINLWVLREACHQNKAWQSAGLKRVPVSVNLCQAQFKRRDFLASLTGILAETGLDPHFLELELTENIVMGDAETAIGVLRNLKGMGVNISIDDFGTGYSSLSHLRRFPIDTLKIDQSFVRDLTTNEDDAAITSAIISMAKSLRLRVVDEGVESQEQLDFLFTEGCDAVQGYHYCRPLPAEEFAQLLS